MSWYGPNVRHMLDVIGQNHKRHWFPVLCNTLYFSEYVLYGVYVDLLVQNDTGHYCDSQSLCHCCWGYNLNSEQEIDRFLSELGDNHIAVLIQSNLAIPVDMYRGIVESRGFI